MAPRACVRACIVAARVACRLLSDRQKDLLAAGGRTGRQTQTDERRRALLCSCLTDECLFTASGRRDDDDDVARFSIQLRVRVRVRLRLRLRLTATAIPPLLPPQSTPTKMAKDRKASLTRIFNKKKGATSSSSSPSSSSAAPSPPSTSMDSARQLVAEPEKMNGSSSSSSVQPSSSRLAPSRTRSGSLSEKGAAVLRALQRAPEDESPEDTPPGALTPHLEVDTKVEAADDDAGYAPEGLDGVSPRPLAQHQPRNGNGGAGDLADVSRAGSIVGLSEEQKLQGRANREGLRRRGEAKEVEKIVGSGRPGARRGGSGSEGKKSKKSWEIPRKIFHSSIGELAPCKRGVDLPHATTC